MTTRQMKKGTIVHENSNIKRKLFVKYKCKTCQEKRERERERERERGGGGRRVESPSYKESINLHLSLFLSAITQVD